MADETNAAGSTTEDETVEAKEDVEEVVRQDEGPREESSETQDESAEGDDEAPAPADEESEDCLDAEAEPRDGKPAESDGDAAETVAEPSARPQGDGSEQVAGPEGEPDAPEDGEPDAPETASPQQRIIGTAQRAAQVGTQTVTEGVSAMRELSAARRAHATAFKELETLERGAKELAEQLEHRRDVEENYECIVEVQTAEIEGAARALERERVRRATLESQLEGKTNELKRLRDANDQKVAPSRKLMEQAKDALSKAERAQAEARRALKVAQTQADEATASRDSKLQAAKRMADAASAKLARQQDQLTEMRRDPSAGAKGLSQASSAVATALAQLENARENVTRVTQETSQAVQIAQTHLYTQRKSLEEAEADLKEAREREKELRRAYDAKRSAADEQEQGVSSKISELKASVAQARDDEAAARGRGDAARAALEEAHDIHAHPELTDELEGRARTSRAQADEQRALVERLANEERMVRERTQHTRKIFYALVAVAALIVLLVLAFALGA